MGKTSHMVKECNCIFKWTSIFRKYLSGWTFKGKGHWLLISDNCRTKFDNKRYKRVATWSSATDFLLFLLSFGQFIMSFGFIFSVFFRKNERYT